MDFNTKRVQWMMMCVTTVSYFMALNGAEFGPIQSGFTKEILFLCICLLFVLKVFQPCFDGPRFGRLFMAVRLVGRLQVLRISFLLMIGLSSFRQRRKSVLLKGIFCLLMR